MSITVYTRPGCVQCNATFRALDKAGADYSNIDVTQDSASLDHIKQLGHMQAPVVETTTDHWSGFRPDKISKLPE